MQECYFYKFLSPLLPVSPRTSFCIRTGREGEVGSLLERTKNELTLELIDGKAERERELYCKVPQISVNKRAAATMPVVLSGADQAQRRDCLLLTASERGKEHVRISLRTFSSHSNKIYTCLRRSLIKDL